MQILAQLIANMQINTFFFLSSSSLFYLQVIKCKHTDRRDDTFYARGVTWRKGWKFYTTTTLFFFFYYFSNCRRLPQALRRSATLQSRFALCALCAIAAADTGIAGVSLGMFTQAKVLMDFSLLCVNI